MRLLFVLLAAVALLGVVFAGAAAAEKSEVDLLLDLLVQKGIITAAEAEELRAAAVAAPPPADLVDQSKSLLSKKKERLNFSGELELEFVDTETGYGVDNGNHHFQIDKFVLRPIADLNDHVHFESEITTNMSGASLNESWVKIHNWPVGQYLKVGLDERFYEPNRITEGYALTSTAFSRSVDELAIEYGGMIDGGWFFWKARLGNGHALGTASVGEDGGHRVLADGRLSSDWNNSKSYGIGLGTNPDFGDAGKLKFMGFYFWNNLTTMDIDTLAGIAGYLNHYDKHWAWDSELMEPVWIVDMDDVYADNDSERWGFWFNYKVQGFDVDAQYIDAEDGHLDRDAWHAQVAYKIATGTSEWFTHLTPVLRYSDLNVTMPHYYHDPLTWDRDKWTVGLITEITANCRLKTEYCFQGETTGWDEDYNDHHPQEIDNDELCIQLEVHF